MKKYYIHFGNGETPQIKRFKKYKKWLNAKYSDMDFEPKGLHKKYHKLLDKAIKSIILSYSEFEMIQLFRQNNALFVEINTQLKQEHQFIKSQQTEQEKCKILPFEMPKNAQKEGNITNYTQNNAFTYS